ncbi:MAG: putative selenium-dependent hydroxylase accessory protein YqeC, partial [Thermoanaerobacterales bacterium]|nr:putative selenium-dependent hydroxylase accessory protein YqeC [Thermoanaerobacterales bacterium]
NITWAWGKTSDGKITGVLPEYLDVIHGQKKFDFILVEADGSKQKPLKAPAVYEPVIPKRTSIVLGLMGIDAMGKPLDGKNVHRPENIEDITGRPIGSVIDAEMMAKIALHDQGLFKNSGTASTKILVLNKVDNDAAISAALTLARTVKKRMESEGAYVRRYGRINRVILTSIKKKNPVIYILDI